jgi:hypothetical protein
METIPAAVLVFERPQDVSEAQLRQVGVELIDWHLFIQYPLIGALEWIALDAEEMRRFRSRLDSPDAATLVLEKLGALGKSIIQGRRSFDFHWQDADDSGYGKVHLLWIAVAGQKFPPEGFGAETL